MKCFVQERTGARVSLMLLEALYWVSSLGWMLRAITQDEAMMAVFEHGICLRGGCVRRSC